MYRGIIPRVNPVMGCGLSDQQASPGILESEDVMIFSDILALAKAGYSPADVKELLSFDTGSSSNTPPVTPNTPAGGDINKEDPKQEPKEEPKEDPKQEPTEDPKQEPTEEQRKIAELEQALAEAQKFNINKDLSDKIISDEDKLKDLFRGFM